MSATRTRVAILGGGAGSMTAAYYLSCTPERRARFDVTVYQMGWRLGGKGASGRRASRAQRIEEHGLHVWGGFYHNAFRTMRLCYDALGRPADAPLATVEQAFLPAPDVFWEEQIGSSWHHWPIEVADNGGVPGEGGELPTPADYFRMVVGFIRDVVVDFPHEAIRAHLTAPAPSLTAAVMAAARDAGHLVRDVADGSVRGVLDAAHALAAAIAAGRTGATHDDVLQVLDDWWRRLVGGLIDVIAAHDASRRLFVLGDLGMAAARGMVRDGVLARGFMTIDAEDFAGWLARHGAHPLSLDSAPLRGYYDYFFAYDHGDPSQPRMSAAMGLYHLLRLGFTYKGSLFFKMASGMGDAVFGPLYEVCRRNGVRVAFFHEVLEVVPDPLRNTIAAVRVNRQVETKGQYEPLVMVNGLPSWPSEPLLDQVRDDQADRLRASHADLEDPWSGWDGGTETTLRAGEDFDVVVLGVPVGAHRALCPQLVARLPEWQQMVDALHTIQTQALQLWFTRTTASLGATGTLDTGTGYGQPFESWSDMSHVLDREDWTGSDRPQGVVYLCGPMPTPPVAPTGPDPAFGAAQRAAARQAALTWTRAFLPHLYPVIAGGDDIDWDVLAAPAGVQGQARLDAQYIRANYTPSERYVLDLPDTSRHRLDAGASGFDNLLLAGDWVFTGLGGAVESAVIGGMQAAEALLGEPLGIVGALPNPWSRLPRFTPPPL